MFFKLWQIKMIILIIMIKCLDNLVKVIWRNKKNKDKHQFNLIFMIKMKNLDQDQDPNQQEL